MKRSVSSSELVLGNGDTECSEFFFFLFLFPKFTLHKLGLSRALSQETGRNGLG